MIQSAPFVVGEAPDIDATVLVVGYGSIGARHVANLLQMGPRIYVDEPDPARAAMIPAGVSLLPPGLGERDITHVVTCTPARAHRMRWCPAPQFVEKPLAASTVMGYGAFQCPEHAPRIQVGYQFRFDAALGRFRDRVREMREREEILSVRVEFGYDVRRWRPDGVVAPYVESGILLEASHELDMIRWIFGDPVDVQSAWTGRRLGGLAGDEDTAIALVFAQGIPIELHLDMTLPAYRRQIEVFGSRSYASWVFVPGPDLNRMYVDEMRAFLADEPDPRAATFDDGMAVLELIEQIRAAAR